MLLSDAIDRYKADRINKGYVKSTVRSEQTTLRTFLSDVGNIQVAAIDHRHMDLFWSRHTEWSPGTWNLKRTHLNTFFEWCRTRGVLPRTSNPMEGTRRRKDPQRDWTVIPQQEWPALLDATPHPRDRIMVAIGLYLFTRVSETTALRWKDIDFQNHEAAVFRVKTQTLDILPICEELEHELKVWKLAYAEMQGEHVKPGWYVVPPFAPVTFTGVPGKKGQLVRTDSATLLPTVPIRDNAASRIKSALISAGYPVQSGEASHTLRRSGANALYHELSERGHDRAIRMCQAMLGHSSIQTTEVYLQLNLDRKARNDLLAGKKMFTGGGEATVHHIGGVDGQKDPGAVRM